MKTLVLASFVLFGQMAFSQGNDIDAVPLETNRLISYKTTYEQLKNYADYNPARYASARDSAYHAYVQQTNKIKCQSDTYLAYIKEAVETPKLAKDFIIYGYINTTFPFDPNLHVVSQQDLYRIIKHYLFEQNADLLPEHLASIPFVKRDHYPPFKLQSIEDIVGDTIPPYKKDRGRN